MKILLGEIMCKKNLTVRQVSAITGLPKSTIADIVSGRASPRMETMEQLAVGMKVRITDLFEPPLK